MTLNTPRFLRVRSVVCGVGVALAALCLPAPAPAIGPYPGPDPVEQLRQALAQRVLDPENVTDRRIRRKNLETAAANLRLSDLRRALALYEWQDAVAVEDIATIDRDIRRSMIERLQNGLKQLASGGTASKLAALTQIAEVGVDVRGIKGYPLVEELDLTDQLITLLGDSEPAVREAAARTLGTIYPTKDYPTKEDSATNRTIAALGKALRQNDAGLRRAAADALANLLRITVLKLKDQSDDFVAAGTSETGAAAAQRRQRVPKPIYNKAEEAVDVAKLIIDEIGPGLSDPDVDVRRYSLEAFQLGGGTLQVLTTTAPLAPDYPPPGRQPSEDQAKRIEKYRQDIDHLQAKGLDLTKALDVRIPKVAETLKAADPTLRLLAAQGLQAVASPRVKLLRLRESIPEVSSPVPGTKAPKASPDVSSAPTRSSRFFKTVAREADAPDQDKAAELRRLLTEGASMERALPLVQQALKDSDLNVRIEALYVIETLGKDAAVAAPALTAALSDTSPFVRWAAARTLGKLGADKVNLEETIPALAECLKDRDLDVRRYAADALGKFGPAAVEAIPALTRQAGADDPEIRIGAIYALRSINRPKPATVEAFIGQLSNPDSRVRVAAADAIRQFGPVARAAAPELQKIRNQDGDPDVRKAAADALLSVLSE